MAMRAAAKCEMVQRTRQLALSGSLAQCGCSGRGQDGARNVGTLPLVEDRMCGFAPTSHGDVDLRSGGHSVDRVDSLIGH